MTIRLRLLLWYFSVTFAIVLLFSLGSYWGMLKLLFRALDEELTIVGDAIERLYVPDEHKFDFTLHDSGTSGRYLQFYLVVYDREGIPVFLSPMTRRVSLKIPLQSDDPRVGYTVRTPVSPDVAFVHPNASGEVTFRVIVHTLYYRNQKIGWAVVGLPIQKIEESMRHLLQVLLTGITSAVVLIGIGGYFLTRKSLHPIDMITSKAKHISHSNLDERLEIENRKDEIGRLTIVLNNLLERLQKAFESQRLFLADAAHELKTPLSILRSHWEGELNNPKLSLEIKEKLVQDVETITRLNHLINNLLLLSQTESVVSNFEFTPLQLDQLLGDVVSDAEILAEIKSQNLRITATQPVTITGDKNRLYQLFFNLIDNAIKYTPNGGNIAIGLAVEEESVVVTVRDDGIGITNADLAHIFERFYRVDKDRARKTGGSGLGLAICKLLAESHGGEIEATSKAGEGSLFAVKLPL